MIWKKRGYVKSTERNYRYAFKLRIVEEVKSGELGIKETTRQYVIQPHGKIITWLRKYSDFDWLINQHWKHQNRTVNFFLELEQKVLLQERQKKELENKVDTADKKVIFFDMMNDFTEELIKIPTTKKYSFQQSPDIKTTNKKA